MIWFEYKIVLCYSANYCMEGLDDTQLIIRCQQEDHEDCQTDRQAFNELVLKYQDKLYNSVYRLVNNQSDAQDICQEAFIRAFRNIKNFKGNSSFQTWLYQIALNQFYTHYQKSKREQEKKVEKIQESNSNTVNVRKPSEGFDDPAQHVQSEEQKQAIEEALDALPIELKRVVVLKDIEGFSYEEIAQILKISIHTVRKHLCEAREELRYALKKYL